MKNNDDKIEIIDKKIEILKARKQKMVALENQKNRKLLTKQKILVGAYRLNQLEKESLQAKKQFLNDIKKTIDEKRKSDFFAVNELIKQFTDDTENEV